MISGLIVAGIIARTNYRIARERYNDSVNSFAEFLRDTYDSVANVQNSKSISAQPGRSQLAIYGKLVVFSDSTDIRTYSVIGLANSSSDLSTDRNTLDTIKALDANIISLDNANPFAPTYSFYEETHTTIVNDATLETPSGDYRKGLLMIIWSPNSGSIHSYFADYEIAGSPARQIVDMIDPNEDSMKAFSATLDGYFRESSVGEKGTLVDFCVDSYTNSYPMRRNVRILAGAMNPSGIDIYAMDDPSNHCLDNSNAAGNRPGE